MPTDLSGKEIRDQIIQAGINAIPYVGGAIASLYFGIQNEKRFKRLEYFYKNLKEDVEANTSEIDKLKNSKYDDSTVAIIDKINEKIEYEETEAKIKYYKNIFKNNILNPLLLSYEQKKIFIDATDSLSVLDIDLLDFIVEQNTRISVNSIRKDGFSSYEILGSINRLTHFGFIETYIGRFMFNGTMDTSLLNDIKVSEYGKRFYDFIFK